MRAYSIGAGLALVALGCLGFSGVLGWDWLASTFHLSVGILYLVAVLLLKGGSYLREAVGGLGVLLVVAKAATILSPELLGDDPPLGPIEVTCLLLGVTSTLAARFIPKSDP